MSKSSGCIARRPALTTLPPPWGRQAEKAVKGVELRRKDIGLKGQLLRVLPKEFALSPSDLSTADKLKGCPSGALLAWTADYLRWRVRGLMARMSTLHQRIEAHKNEELIVKCLQRRLEIEPDAYRAALGYAAARTTLPTISTS